MVLSVLPVVVWQHPLLAGALAVLLILTLLLCGRRGSVSQRRHRHYQRQAERALMRLSQLRDDAARFTWLRKANPYVFEEMLLTAFSRQG